MLVKVRMIIGTSLDTRPYGSSFKLATASVVRDLIEVRIRLTLLYGVPRTTVQMRREKVWRKGCPKRERRKCMVY